MIKILFCDTICPVFTIDNFASCMYILFYEFSSIMKTQTQELIVFVTKRPGTNSEHCLLLTENNVLHPPLFYSTGQINKIALVFLLWNSAAKYGYSDSGFIFAVISKLNKRDMYSEETDNTSIKYCLVCGLLSSSLIDFSCFDVLIAVTSPS